MSLRAIGAVEQPINYSQLRALVVDDFPGMRSALKMTLSNFGLVRIDMTSSAAEAVFKSQHNAYDLILCDYNLGEGRDGQQLLEELRHRGLIRLEAVFIMVTAESIYERVVATAELAPDDYLIKPFSAELLRNRLDNILRRKLAFAEVYRHFEEGDLDAAIVGCDDLMREQPKYVVDALRFKGESLNAVGRFEEAEVLYQQVIKMRAIPWARLGLARALHQQNKNTAAEQVLRDVLDASPELVAGYDLLAEVRLANKDSAGAQSALEAGVAVSARTVRRQQKLGHLAMDNADLDTAHAAFANALEKGRHSVFITPADYGNLCRVQLEKGHPDAALETLKKGKLALQGSPEGQMVSAVVQAQAYSRSGRGVEARKALDEAMRLHGAGAHADASLLLDLVRTSLDQGRHDTADTLVREVARNAHDSEALLSKAIQLYQQSGRAEVGSSLLAEATGDVRRLNNEGVMLAHKGQFATAVERMVQACDLAPRNPRVLMNAIWVLLKCLEADGLDEEKLERSRELLAEVERLNPGHSRIHGLRKQMKDVEKRYGIRRRNES